MKYVFIGLAFCSGAYIVLACFIQGMAGPQSVSVPLSLIMFRALQLVALYVVSSPFPNTPCRDRNLDCGHRIRHNQLAYQSHMDFPRECVLFIWPTLFLTAALLADKWRGSTRTRHRLNWGHRIPLCETSRR